MGGHSKRVLDVSRVIRSPRPQGSWFPVQVIPAALGAFAFAWICNDLVGNRKIFGGETVHTMTPEWQAETSRLFDAGWPRQGSPNPVVMNPISRQNYRKVE